MCRLYLRSRRTSNLAGCPTTPAFETERRGVMPRGSTGCGTGLAGQNYIEDGCPASPFFAANGLTKPDTFVTNRQTRLAHCVSRLLLQAAATVLPFHCAHSHAGTGGYNSRSPTTLNPRRRGPYSGSTAWARATRNPHVEKSGAAATGIPGLTSPASRRQRANRKSRNKPAAGRHGTLKAPRADSGANRCLPLPPRSPQQSE